MQINNFTYKDHGNFSIRVVKSERYLVPEISEDKQTISSALSIVWKKAYKRICI